MRYILLTFVAVLVAVVAIAGFRGSPSRRPPIEIFADMVRQPKQRPQFQSEFFADQRGSRPRPAGTIARGEPYEDTPWNTGRLPGTTNFVASLPAPVTHAMLARGQERYLIHCAPCHGAQADGNGITKKIGAMGVVANLHDKRIVELADGELFNTISHGKNLMSGYAAQIAIEDRWAIIAYLRALQLARLGTVEDVPQEMRARLK
ncbi:MAG: cytochrome c [Verrucomicrobiae bacterium]|nr:cytochrome c [Verrucomicrobiae bacterium]